MSNEQYLPERPSAGQADAAVLHTRNKTILADFASPTLRERAIRWLWYHLSRCAQRRTGSQPTVCCALRATAGKRLAASGDGCVGPQGPRLRWVRVHAPAGARRSGHSGDGGGPAAVSLSDERVQILQHDILQPMTDLPEPILIWCIRSLRSSMWAWEDMVIPVRREAMPWRSLTYGKRCALEVDSSSPSPRAKPRRSGVIGSTRHKLSRTCCRLLRARSGISARSVAGACGGDAPRRLHRQAWVRELLRRCMHRSRGSQSLWCASPAYASVRS